MQCQSQAKYVIAIFVDLNLSYRWKTQNFHWLLDSLLVVSGRAVKSMQQWVPMQPMVISWTSTWRAVLMAGWQWVSPRTCSWFVVTDIEMKIGPHSKLYSVLFIVYVYTYHMLTKLFHFLQYPPYVHTLAKSRIPFICILVHGLSRIVCY